LKFSFLSEPFYKALAIVFVILSLIIIITTTPLGLHGVLLLSSNLSYLLLSIFTYKIMMKPTAKPHAIINQMLAGTMLRLFIVALGMLVIIYFYRMNISKLNYAILFLMYIIYTFVESKYAISNSKKNS
jgi:hypothetical protein